VSAVAAVTVLETEPEFEPGAPPPATLFADTWRGIAAENPVLVQMLGMCPTMAVTNVLANGIAMGIATMSRSFASTSRMRCESLPTSSSSRRS